MWDIPWNAKGKRMKKVEHTSLGYLVIMTWHAFGGPNMSQRWRIPSWKNPEFAQTKESPPRDLFQNQHRNEMTCWVILKQHWPIKNPNENTSSNLKWKKMEFTHQKLGEMKTLTFTTLWLTSDESNYEDLWSAIMLTNHMVEQEMFRRLWKCMEFRDIGKKKLYKML